MSNVYPSNLQESQIANYAVSCDLHSLITVYKGFSDNKFVDFLNKTYPQCDDKGNIISNFTSVSAVKIDGEMQFAVFFDDGESTADLYPFKSERVKNWLRNYLDKCITRIEWK